jgi:hypothetical protein
LRGIRANQIPGFSPIEYRSQTTVHIADRFGGKPWRKRVEKILKFDGAQFREFRRTPSWQNVSIEMKVVADASRILQQRPHLFPTNHH